MASRKTAKKRMISRAAKATRKTNARNTRAAARVSPETVLKVARVARLYVSDAEAAALSKDLSDILAAFRELDAAKVRSVEPSFQPLPVKDVLRADEIEPSLKQGEALRNTKHREKGFFKGPRAV